MQTVVNLRPENYPISKLDDEIAIMAMMKALPREEYNSFISSLLLLSTLDKDSVLEVFRTEETQRQGALEESNATAAIAAAAAARELKCYICDGPHVVRDCPRLEDSRTLAKSGKSSKDSRNRKRGGRRGGGSASGNTAAANVPGEDGPAQSAESAVCLSAGSPPSADTHWNADTGASASMTPHSHWIVADRKPWRVAVYVANGEVVYSTEKGSVIFQPSGKQSNGKPRAAVVLQDVLVVPRLANNLLSVLTLTTKRKVNVNIRGPLMSFTQNHTTLFTATANAQLTAFLDGHVVCKPASSANHVSALRASTVIDHPLLHQQFCHLGTDRLEQLIRQNMTTDLKISSTTPLPAVCKPCISGKQHQHKFPKSAD